jgi:hypothetical protein
MQRLDEAKQQWYGRSPWTKIGCRASLRLSGVVEG